FIEIEQFKHFFNVGIFEVIGRLFHFILMEHITIRYRTELTFGPNQIINRIYTLQVHCKTFKTIRDFTSHWVAFNTTDLLEVSELRHFHAIEPNLPTKIQSIEWWRLRVVFYETDVMN